MKRKVAQALLMATLSVGITSCTAPVRYQEAAPGKIDFAVNSDHLRNAVEIGNVVAASEGGTGPEKVVSADGTMHPFTTASVTDDTLRDAMRLGLENQGWLTAAGSKGRFSVNLALVSAVTTQYALTITANVSVRYNISDRTTGKTIYQGRIQSQGKSLISDPLFAYESGRTPVESALRQNIENLLRHLSKLKP